jgi:hypothetical protein
MSGVVFVVLPESRSAVSVPKTTAGNPYAGRLINAALKLQA